MEVDISVFLPLDSTVIFEVGSTDTEPHVGLATYQGLLVSTLSLFRRPAVTGTCDHCAQLFTWVLGIRTRFFVIART